MEEEARSASRSAAVMQQRSTQPVQSTSALRAAVPRRQSVGSSAAILSHKCLCLRRYYYKMGWRPLLVPLTDNQKRALDGITIAALLAKYARVTASEKRGVKPNGPLWSATAHVLGQQQYLGSFVTEEAAGQMYDGVAIAQGKCDPSERAACLPKGVYCRR